MNKKIKELGAIKQKKVYFMHTLNIIVLNTNVEATYFYYCDLWSHYHYPHVPLPNSCSCLPLNFPQRIKNMILTNAVSFSARPYSARPFVAHSVQILQSRKVLFSFLDVLLNHIYAKCIHAVNHTLQGTFPDRKIICIYVPSLTVDLTRNAR